MITYEPLWITLKKKEISQYRLIKEFGFSTGQLSRMRSNQHVSTHTLERLCEILDCEIKDVVKYQKD